MIADLKHLRACCKGTATKEPYADPNIGLRSKSGSFLRSRFQLKTETFPFRGVILQTGGHQGARFLFAGGNTAYAGRTGSEVLPEQETGKMRFEFSATPSHPVVNHCNREQPSTAQSQNISNDSIPTGF